VAVEEEPPGPDLTTEGGDSHVIDEANYSHHRRLQAVHNARDRVMNVRNMVEEELISGTLSEFRARQFYRGAVEALILEILPILESDQIQLDQEYLEGVDLGTVTVEPPDWLVQHARENINRLAPGATVPTPVHEQVIGLRWILDAPSPLAHEFSVVTQHGKSGVDPESAVGQAEIPRDVLDNAVREAGKALEEAEMGLNVGEERPRNSLSVDGKEPWEEELPHEILDAYEEGIITKQLVAELREQQSSDPMEGIDEG